ncbi:MAG: potassium channel family protein [Chloroflexi bacterium]|nr:potassium channel family protein [Chloroflexota bacterium]
MRGSAAERWALLARLERATELPLTMLSTAMLPLLAGAWLWQPGPTERAVGLGIYLSIWAVFAAELGVRVALAPQRAGYLRAHWFDLLVALFPAIRPVRIGLIVCFGSRLYPRAVRFAQVDYLAAYAVGLVLLSATAVTTLERGQGGPIDSFADALWWSVATVTTVGYGDVVPVTAAGRALAYVLMLGGIGLFAALTANLASKLSWRADLEPARLAALVEELSEMREAVERLERRETQS